MGENWVGLLRGSGTHKCYPGFLLKPGRLMLMVIGSKTGMSGID